MRNSQRKSQFRRVYLITTGVRQVQFGLFQFEWNSRRFSHEFDVNGFSRLYPNHQFIAFALTSKYISGHIPELNTNLGFPFVQCFSCNSNQFFDKIIENLRQLYDWPQRKKNGMPSQRSLFMWHNPRANVGVTEPLGTVGSSKYPSLASPLPLGSPIYWPKTTSSKLKGWIHFKTFT